MDENLTFRSGRKLDAPVRNLGIDERLRPTCGSDESLRLLDGEYDLDDFPLAEQLTPEERHELAEYVSGLWMKWADNAGV